MTTDTASSTANLASRGLSRRRQPGLDATFCDKLGWRELHLTVRPLPGEEPAMLVARAAAVLREHQASVVRHEIFAPLASCDSFLAALNRELGGVQWPITYVEGGPCGEHAISGMHLMAVAGAAVQPVSLHGRIVGTTFTDKWARYVLLGDVQPTQTNLDRNTQAQQAYENMEAALAQCGMTMRQVARTWLFIQDILDWYGPFNAVRTEFYSQRGIFNGIVPASTGVSGENPHRSALTAGTWAVEGTNGTFHVSEVASPKQCAATAYGSSFSRAVEMITPALRRLLVSGTASIEPGGRSVCGGDIEAQIDLTMEVVRAIMVSRRMDFADASRVTAYFKNPADARYFELWCRKHRLEQWPLICTRAHICREELLFEVELDAVAESGK